MSVSATHYPCCAPANAPRVQGSSPNAPIQSLHSGADVNALELSLDILTGRQRADDLPAPHLQALRESTLQTIARAAEDMLVDLKSCFAALHLQSANQATALIAHKRAFDAAALVKQEKGLKEKKEGVQDEFVAKMTGAISKIVQSGVSAGVTLKGSMHGEKANRHSVEALAREKQVLKGPQPDQDLINRAHEDPRANAQLDRQLADFENRSKFEKVEIETLKRRADYEQGKQGIARGVSQVSDNSMDGVGNIVSGQSEMSAQESNIAAESWSLYAEGDRQIGGLNEDTAQRLASVAESAQRNAEDQMRSDREVSKAIMN